MPDGCVEAQSPQISEETLFQSRRQSYVFLRARVREQRRSRCSFPGTFMSYAPSSMAFTLRVIIGLILRNIPRFRCSCAAAIIGSWFFGSQWITLFVSLRVRMNPFFGRCCITACLPPEKTNRPLATLYAARKFPVT